MEFDARHMKTALRCRAVFMRRASSSILCRGERPESRYIFLLVIPKAPISGEREV